MSLIYSFIYPKGISHSCRPIPHHLWSPSKSHVAPALRCSSRCASHDIWRWSRVVQGQKYYPEAKLVIRYDEQRCLWQNIPVWSIERRFFLKTWVPSALCSPPSPSTPLGSVATRCRRSTWSASSSARCTKAPLRCCALGLDVVRVSVHVVFSHASASLR